MYWGIQACSTLENHRNLSLFTYNFRILAESIHDRKDTRMLHSTGTSIHFNDALRGGGPADADAHASFNRV